MNDSIAETDATPKEVLADDVVNVPKALPDQSAPKDEAEAKPEKPKSVGDSVKAAMDKVLKDDGEAKPEKAAKPEPKEEKPAADDKPEAAKPSAEAKKPDTAAGQEGEEKPPSEGKQVNAPARLLPRAREVWVNTPRAVQDEFDRMEREYKAEAEKHREAKALHDELREYDGLAKQHNTSIKQALDRYVDFDRKIAADFGRGVAEIAQSQQKTPQEAIASVLRAYGLTPQQYAQHVTQNPQAHQAPAMQQQPQRQQPQPDLVAQRAIQEVAQLKAEIAQRDLHSQVIAPFAAQHPRLTELEEPVAKILKSGIVPDSLSPAERLATAYDMAERIYPPLRQSQQAPDGPDDPPATVSTDSGRKSISGAPGNGLTHKGKPKVLSIKESIDLAMRKA